ncbi:helix-turn-helix domain-containing protein [Streptomyces sp. NPDC052077]|uniref:helix-turn-helix domain-containing protein n=1 Tax=unclassified Streptomyces TaxID=2593676 RepID=UPI003448C2BD
MPSGRCGRAGCAAGRRPRPWLSGRGSCRSTPAGGYSVTEVSRGLRGAPDTVRTWRRRFIERGPDGLCDDPRPGVPRGITGRRKDRRHQPRHRRPRRRHRP